MSTVPYIFANNTGNIPLSELDANFANCKSSVDYAAVAGEAAVATTANTAAQANTATTAATATTANTANTAATVTSSSQPTITSVGTLVSLTVNGTIASNGVISAIGNILSSGNVLSGNLLTNGIVSATSNVAGGNVLTVGLISATGNLTSGNVNTSNISLSGNVISALNVTGNIAGGNVLTAGFISAAGNVRGANINTAGLVTATGNVIGGNILTSGTISAAGVVYSASVNTGTVIATGVSSDQIQGPSFLSYTNTTYPETPVDTVSLGSGGVTVFAGLEQYSINYIRITANATSESLSTTTSTNIIQANNTGYTTTLVFPSDWPVTQGTVVKFTVTGGNAVTLIGDADTLDIVPSFDGLTASGTGYTYMLVLEPFKSGYWARVV
jgi:hypothetical protein